MYYTGAIKVVQSRPALHASQVVHHPETAWLPRLRLQ